MNYALFLFPFVPKDARRSSQSIVTTVNRLFCLAMLFVLTCLSSSANAQTGEWAWMGGSNAFNQLGVYGDLGIPALSNVPGNRSAATNWTDRDGNLWLFGGEGYDAYGNLDFLNDLWKFKPSTGEWTWMAGSSTGQSNGVYGSLGTPAAKNTPGGREFASSWTDEDGHLWLFGGFGPDMLGHAGLLNDLWEFDPSTNEWTWRSGSSTMSCDPQLLCGQSGTYGNLGQPSPGSVPGGRDASQSWTDASGNLWLFGGYGLDASKTEGNLNDLWEFNPSTDEWVWKGGNSLLPAGQGGQGSWPAVYGTLGTPAPGNSPGSRMSAATWTDGSGNFWLLGGTGYQGGMLSDLWEFDPSTNEWIWRAGTSTPEEPGVYGDLGTSAAGNNPGSRMDAVSWTDDKGYLWLFGGAGIDAKRDFGGLGDLWRFSSSTNQWAWMGGSSSVQSSAVSGLLGAPAAADTPGTRGNASGWTDHHGNLWLFGGMGYSSSITFPTYPLRNDLWVYQPSVGALPATTPAFSLKAGRYAGTQALSISDATTNAKIHYTLDGSTPTSKSTLYASALSVASTTTVKAIAEAPGFALSATAEATFTILKSQAIVFAQLTSPVVYGTKPIALSATASSGLAVTFKVQSGPAKVSASALIITGAGTVVVAANQSGNSVYAAAPQVTRTITVNKAAQSIAFTQPTSPVTYGVGHIPLSATASSGLPVTLKVVSGAAELIGSTLTVTGAGTVVLTASQGGNSAYVPAKQVVQKLIVNKAKLIVTANHRIMKQGSVVPALNYAISGFVNGQAQTIATTGQPTLSTTATSKSLPGSYPITVKAGTLTAPNYSFTFVNGTLTVTKYGRFYAPPESLLAM